MVGRRLGDGMSELASIKGKAVKLLAELRKVVRR
jgi:hypothetical protein